MNGGDFKYDFSSKTYQQKVDNKLQTVSADEYYGVDSELKAAVTGYKTKLISVGGMSSSSDSEKETESTKENATDDQKTTDNQEQTETPVNNNISGESGNTEEIPSN